MLCLKVQINSKCMYNVLYEEMTVFQPVVQQSIINMRRYKKWPLTDSVSLKTSLLNAIELF